MLEILILSVIVFLLLLSSLLNKDHISFFFIRTYLLWWAILLLISLTDPYDLYPVSAKAYVLLLISVSSFSIGFIAYRLANKTPVKNYTIEKNSDWLMKSYDHLKSNTFFIIFLILSILFVSQYLIAYQRAIILHGTEEARTMRFYVGEVFKSTSEVFFYNYIIETFSIFVSLYIAYSLVWLKFNKTLILTILFSFVYSSFGAGRFFVVELGFYIAFLFFIRRYSQLPNCSTFLPVQKKIKSQQVKILSIVLPSIFFLYLFSIYLSNFRRGVFEISIETFLEGNVDFFEQIVVYCVGSFRAFDYGLSYLVNPIGFTYGSLSFGGIDEIIGLILQAFGFNYNYGNALYGYYTSEMFQIGKGQYYNALFTNVFGQYLDLSYFGVTLLSSFWGILFSRAINVFSRKQSIYSMFIVSFLFITAVMTPLVWKLQAPSAWIFIITMYLFHKLHGKKLTLY